MDAGKITPKQAEFCRQYMVDFNGKQAAIRAGYSPKAAEFQAARMLRYDKVQDYLTKLQAEARAMTDITKEEILAELASILRAKISDYLYFNGYQIAFKSFDQLTEPQIKAIESIKENRYGEIELKLHGKSWTIEKICKILGFDATQDLNINFDKMDEAAIDMIINRLTQREDEHKTG
jgi:phage terminase small subunit